MTMQGMAPPPAKKPIEAISLKTILLVLLALSGVAGLIYWKTRPAPSSPPEKLPLSSDVAAYQVELTPTPYPFAPGRPVHLDVHLFYQGKALPGAALSGEAHRPSDSARTIITFADYGNGGYSGELPVDEKGEWNVTLHFIDGGRQQSVSFWPKAK